MACDETVALRRKLDVLERLKERAEAGSEELREKLRRVIAQRNDLLQLVAEIETTLNPRDPLTGEAALARIASAKRKWSEERQAKKSGG